MMLPEHVEALQQYKKESQKKRMPMYEEQMLGWIGYALQEAYQLKCKVTVTLFGEEEDKQYVGRIAKLDQQLRRVKIENEEDYTWINLDEILLIERI